MGSWSQDFANQKLDNFTGGEAAPAAPPAASQGTVEK